LKVEPLKRKEKKNWEKREGLVFRGKKKKLPIGSLLDFTCVIEYELGVGGICPC
jgi:hypothetical protein